MHMKSSLRLSVKKPLEVRKLAEMTGKDSCRTGTLELDKDDLIVNETLKGKLQAGDVVLITQISEETFAILAKAGEL